MIFQPLNKHVEVKPINVAGVIATQGATFEEKGTVISIADGVTLVDVGDIAYFDSWLCAKYVDEQGQDRYLVPEENIRAKENGQEQVSK